MKRNPAWLVDSIINYEQGSLNDDDIIEFFQRLVDSGLAWQLQGHYGRTATMLLEAGVITPPKGQKWTQR